jgi:hypothetical protein
MIFLWPVVAVVGFVVLAALVIALATSSTAQYEFERNRVQSQQQSASVPVTVGAAVAAANAAAHAAANGAANPKAPANAEQVHAAAGQQGGADHPAVAVSSAHPAGKVAVEHRTPPAWWLVEEDGSGERAVDGPFHDRLEADWAALAGGGARRPVYGALRADGGVVRRQSPQEQAWLTELGEQLDRLPDDWDQGLTEDEDELVTLVVEVAAALVEAGLSVHDCIGQNPAGGVCLTPEQERRGVLVSWHQHDRMSRDQVRGAETDEAVQRTMNAAVADSLRHMGFDVQSFGSAGTCLVTAAERWW